MDETTLIIFVIMYLYGFPLLIWAAFFDRAPTKKTLWASRIGLIILGLTLVYFFYVLYAVGVN